MKVLGNRKAGTLILASAVVMAACGGGGGDSGNVAPTAAPTTVYTPPETKPPDTSAAPEDTTAETTAETTPPAGDPLETLRAATVKIGSQGTFIDPSFGTQYNVAGVGTGFIIDESGIAVTNNHVVTGAATLEVYLNDGDRPVNARLLGVSECSDLAVIDLEGDGYTALEWGDPDTIIEGLDVYAAGFPLTEEATIEAVDYTLTRGIISSTRADGETNWASVDSVLEHDARIRGGNSGGPLVGTDGRVVGVNYAGLAEADQNFAIGIDEAIPIIEELRTGVDVESIGINGQAVVDPDSGLSGIWVASVKSGSPASDAGIQGGDIITTLEGLVLSTDGTMSDYCDILRTNGPDATLSVEVLRYATEEVLEGEINGRPLEQSFSFAQEVEQVEDGGGSNGNGSYTEYITVFDDTETLVVDIPAEWNDINGAPNPDFGPSIWAAPDIDSFLETFDTPGVILEWSYGTGLDADDIGPEMDFLAQDSICVSDGPQPYEDPLYTGLFEVWYECGGTETLIITLAVTPADGSYLIRMLAQVVTEADLEALDVILNTFVAIV
jgi:serine protease Do